MNPEFNLSSVLSWSPVAGAANYKVRLVNFDDIPDTANVIGEYTTTNTFASGAALIGAAVSGNNYKLFVRAIDASARAGAWSDGLLVTVQVAPAKVVGLTIS